ncbi:hypothetical protein HUT16_34880 [Kitasatospora sp. NA04385]|nr:hypothetical protein [Kitasatospora sp. NA04385]QKW23591.1 hypothetical protein HUT16_34880 [Kitasatospora sp. NA04385]
MPQHDALPRSERVGPRHGPPRALPVPLLPVPLLPVRRIAPAPVRRD